MSTVRFIADLHIGHESMAKKRGFATVEEHDEHIIKLWNQVVAKRDVTYILGDLTMEKSNYDFLNRLNGKKRVVAGNHDMPAHTKNLFDKVESISGIVQYKGIFLTHCPVHPMEMDYRIKKNIHGHIHEKRVMKSIKIFGFTLFSRPDNRYICVSCEHVNYSPKTLVELGVAR
jgi:calcineurin-like phosphoesterase family protein